MNARGMRRRGFTLVELLVVIAIIAVLAGTILVTTTGMLKASKKTITDQTIKATYALLDSRWKEVKEEAAREQVPSGVLTAAGSHPERAKQLWIKIRLKEAFPVNYSEINTCYSDAMTSLIPSDRRRYNATYKQLVAKATSTPSWEYQSSECLLIALSLARAGGGDDALGINWKDGNNNGLKEVVDGWGNPIVFWRFPTGTALQSARPAGTTVNNPLYDSGWSGTASFNTNLHPLLISGQAAYTIPVLMSAGGDGKHGMTANTTSPYSTFSVATSNDTQDNHYSYVIGLAP